MNIKTVTCYKCEEPAASKEHAPPKCLFPKGVRYRTNLITVPSCKEHNQELSHADQTLLQLLLSQPIEENEPFKILNNQFLNRSSVNFNRKLNAFRNQVKEILPATYIDPVTGNKVNSGLVRYKQSALSVYDSLEKLGCALYFNEKQKKLSGNYYVNLDILAQKEEEAKQVQDLYALNQSLFDMFQIEFQGVVPEVFQYRIYDHKSHGNDVIIEFLFYEKIRGFLKYSNSKT